MLSSFLNMMRRYARHDSGVASVAFAMALPAILASAGIAMDFATAYNAKNRMGNALDKATLAAASSTGTDDEVQALMQKFFFANYPSDKFGTPYNVALTINGNVMTATASVNVPTTFMSMVGKDYITVSGETEVVRELAGIEAVLVLDVTGSMAGSNITALKTASTNFINTMFTKIANVDYLKIGIVPWSAAVNVGPYGKGLTPAGGSYGTPFVDNPATDPYISPASSIVYGGGSHWGGCVVERSPSSALTDASSPNWPMYRYPQTCTSYSWWYGCTSWGGNPNTNCPVNPIVPLTNSQSTLQSTINNLQTQGNTYSNIGMVWGWRVISPDFPFTEGVPYTNKSWTKTVILMTDGDNTVNTTYSGEGPYGASGTSTSSTQQNQKLAQVCENMKALGIRIYTVTFQSNINSTTKNYYRNCASSTSMYYDAPSSQDLVVAFQKIADQLSQLHITK